jgi:hypothetical protein
MPEVVTAQSVFVFVETSGLVLFPGHRAFYGVEIMPPAFRRFIVSLSSGQKQEGRDSTTYLVCWPRDIRVE